MQILVTVRRQPPGVNMRAHQCGKKAFAIVFANGRRFRIFATNEVEAELYRQNWFPDCRVESDE